MIQVAALFVDPRGIYSDAEGVDPWGIDRDARRYDGPHPVVAHPPCSRWCALAGLVEARYGHKRGDDGGCFASALANVRRCGGVLEHPAFSKAWDVFDLPTPPPGDRGWARGLDGGWTCRVDQAHYGHVARKSTWLYAYGVDDLPALRWERARGTVVVSWCGNKLGRKNPHRERVTHREAIATPVEFRDILLGIARSVQTRRLELNPQP